MSRKRIVTVTAAIVLAFVVVFAAMSFDTVVDTDVSKIDRTTVIKHTMRDGKTVEVSASVATVDVTEYYIPSDDSVTRATQYLITVSNNGTADYNVRNLRATVILPDNAEYVSSFYNDGSNDNRIIALGHKNDFRCQTDGGNLQIETVLRNEVPLSLTLELTYDLDGRGVRCLNRMIDQAQTITLDPLM